MDINKINEEFHKYLREDRGFIQGLKDDINHFFNGKNFSTSEEMSYLFNKYVPSSGKAKTLGGEIIRALNKIDYRYYNDGDYFFKGYGIETCGACAKFLMNNTNDKIAKIIRNISESMGDRGDYYEKELNKLTEAVIEYVNTHKEVFKTKNTKDMYDEDISGDYSYYFDYDIDWNHRHLRADISDLSQDYESVEDAIEAAKEDLESNGCEDVYDDDFGYNKNYDEGDEVASVGGYLVNDEDEEPEEIQGEIYCTGKYLIF